MFRNYFKTAWRNILRNKTSAFINIAGLSIGLACVIFILLYVQDELSYDKFLKDADRIYQVNLNGNMGGQAFIGGGTPPPAGAALVNAFPEIESYTRIYQPGNTVVRSQNNNSSENYFSEKNIWAVDSNFLQMFSYKLKEGNAAECLQKVNSVVVSEGMAKKYFGSSSPIGKTLFLGDARTPFTVTAVLDKLPAQSSLKFDMLVSIPSYPVVKHFSWSWVWLQVITYVKLKEGTDDNTVKQLQAKFPAMVKTQAASAFERIGQPFDEFIRKGGKWDLELQKLTSIHLYSAGIGSRLTTLSDIKYIYIFSTIALFIIIIACVNFMNLSTAQSVKRSKEVGVRKVLGSEKWNLIKQFLTESVLYSIISTIIALMLVALLLDPFNQLVGKSLPLTALSSGNIWPILLAITIITGLLAGSYPAFYLSSFNPVSVLKGMAPGKTGISGRFIRNGLVVFQFAISTLLIICTVTVFRQLQYTQTKDLGLNKENVLVIANTNRLGNSETTFRDELLKIPEVSNATISTSIPTGNQFTDGYVPVPSSAGNNEQLAKDIFLTSYIVDENFIPALQIKVQEGRNFSKDFADSASVILNEAAAKQIGWKEPLGQYLDYPGGDNHRFKVIGVVKDFNIESLRSTVIPFALFHTSSKTYDIGVSYISARIKTGDAAKAISKLNSKWKSFAPDIPFEYSFLDEEFDALYRSEQQMGVVFTLFSVLSIFIGCIGLFGLAAYTAERRRKEIGIRKVLGASVQGVVAMLSKEFVIMVFIASLVSFPVAWYAMDKWLQDFAYRINIEWWVFAFAGAAALFIAVVTVSFQAIKAAVANPVKSLRTE